MTAGHSAHPAPFLRVERGHAGPDEVVALAVVLYARRHAAAAGAGAATGRRRGGARWRRLERRPVFADPRAWSSTNS